MSVLAILALLAGGGLLVIAAWGVLVLPDALARQHAATKAGTLAVAVVLLGAVLAVAEGEWAWRLALMAGFLLATLPVSSHLLARAALAEMARTVAQEGMRGPGAGEEEGSRAEGEAGDERADGSAEADEDPVEALRGRLERR